MTTSTFIQLQDLAEQTTDLYDEFLLELGHRGETLQYGAELVAFAQRAAIKYNTSNTRNRTILNPRAIHYLDAVTSVAEHFWSITHSSDTTQSLDRRKKG